MSPFTGFWPLPGSWRGPSRCGTTSTMHRPEERRRSSRRRPRRPLAIPALPTAITPALAEHGERVLSTSMRPADRAGSPSGRGRQKARSSTKASSIRAGRSRSVERSSGRRSARSRMWTCASTGTQCGSADRPCAAFSSAPATDRASARKHPASSGRKRHQPDELAAWLVDRGLQNAPRASTIESVDRFRRRSTSRHGRRVLGRIHVGTTLLRRR